MQYAERSVLVVDDGEANRDLLAHESVNGDHRSRMIIIKINERTFNMPCDVIPLVFLANF